MVIVYNARMAMVRVERDVEGGIADYKFSRKMGYNAGTLNEERVAHGELPLMWVSRSLVILEVLRIPLWSMKIEVPTEVVETSRPIPVRHRHADHDCALS